MGIDFRVCNMKKGGKKRNCYGFENWAPEAGRSAGSSSVRRGETRHSPAATAIGISTTEIELLQLVMIGIHVQSSETQTHPDVVSV